MDRAERQAEEARQQAEYEAQTARYKREAEVRQRRQVEAWDHARAALVNAEAAAGAASDTANGNALGWVGIAVGWMMLRERDRGGESDG